MTPQRRHQAHVSPQTPPLPPGQTGNARAVARPIAAHVGNAFKREIDKGTLPGAIVMVARRGQIGWFERRWADRVPLPPRRWRRTPSSASSQ